MRILIVADFFPPKNAIGSLRPYSWAKYWSKNGNNVSVLTTSKEKKSDNTKFDCSTFNVISVPLRIPFARKKIYAEENSQISKAEINNNNQIVKTGLYKYLKNLYISFTIKTGCFWGCRFPDWHDKWIKEAIKKVSPEDYDMLITTAWPYSVHRAGLYFRKKGWKGVWICDWRDAWPENPLFNGLKIFHFHENRLLQKFLKEANAITVVAEGIASYYRKKTNTPVFVIPNGMDEEDAQLLLNRPRANNKKFCFAYTGTLGPDRIPTPFFEAISNLLRNEVIKKEQIEIIFAGSDISDLIEKYQFQEICKSLGKISIEQARQIQYDADEVLFISTDYNGQFGGALSGKIFEYLYLARDIMAIGCTDVSEACKLIKECNAGEWFGNDIKKIENYIIQRINGFYHEKKMDVITQFSREKQASRILDISKEYIETINT